jgi:hypothetical protein
MTVPGSTVPQLAMRKNVKITALCVFYSDPHESHFYILLAGRVWRDKMNPRFCKHNRPSGLCFLPERITIENSLEIGSHEKITKQQSEVHRNKNLAKRGVMGYTTDTYPTFTSQ